MAKDDNDRLREGTLPRDPEDGTVPVAPPIESQPREIRWLTAEQITKPVPQPSYIIDKIALAPGTLSILAGQSFAGKSVIAHDLALAVASLSTSSALGGHGMVNNRGPVALLDYEMGHALTVRRIQRLCRGRGAELAELVEQKRLLVACFPDVKLTDDDAIDRLRSVIEAAELRLVVVDSARAMMPDVDENDSTVRKYIDKLGELADTTKAAVVLLHHAGKLSREQKADPSAYLRGSSGWRDAPSSIYVLTTDDTNVGKSECVFRHIKCRHRGLTAEPFKLCIEDSDKAGKHDRDALRVAWKEWKEAAADDARATVPEAARKDPRRGL